VGEDTKAVDRGLSVGGDMAGSSATTGDDNESHVTSTASTLEGTMSVGGNMTGSSSTVGNNNTSQVNHEQHSSTVYLSIPDSLQSIFYELGKIGGALNHLTSRTEDRFRHLEKSVDVLQSSSNERAQSIAHLEKSVGKIWVWLIVLVALVVVAALWFLVQNGIN
jgi:hypothetical protein